MRVVLFAAVHAHCVWQLALCCFLRKLFRELNFLGKIQLNGQG